MRTVPRLGCWFKKYMVDCGVNVVGFNLSLTYSYLLKINPPLCYMPNKGQATSVSSCVYLLDIKVCLVDG